MNFPRGLFVLLALATLALPAITGCQKAPPIDPARYDATDWEKRLRNPALTEKEFTELYAQAVAAQMPGCTVRVTGPREVTIKSDDGGETKAFVDNAWAEAAHDVEHRPEICRRYLAALATTKTAKGTEPTPLNSSNVVALIRDDLFLKQFDQIAAAKTNHLLVEGLVADLHIVYATDHEGTIAYLTEVDRRQLGLELSAMRGLALTNLQRILPELKIHGPGPLFAVEADGNYESSLLLSDTFWSDQASVVKGDIVAAVPSRDVLIFTGSASPDGLQKLRQLTRTVSEQGDHLISKTLLVRRNGRWEKFSQ
jgi:uncharacterized protein YtpQ (UPF0354 family)